MANRLPIPKVRYQQAKKPKLTLLEEVFYLLFEKVVKEVNIKK